MIDMKFTQIEKIEVENDINKKNRFLIILQLRFW